MRIGKPLSPALSGVLLPSRPVAWRWSSGLESFDAALGGGLAHGRVHEVYAAEAEDGPAAAGFALALLCGLAQDRTALWLRSRRAVREQGLIQAPGWAELGGAPQACLFGVMADAPALLRAALDALRSAALGVVVVEARGRLSEWDLTASRRMALAAEKAGTALLLVRTDAQPVPSAAETRWRVAAAPSHALEARAPGAPVFDVELLRQRAGPAGARWQLEWDRDRRILRDATHPGAPLPLPLRRSLADGAGGSERRVA